MIEWLVGILVALMVIAAAYAVARASVGRWRPALTVGAGAKAPLAERGRIVRTVEVPILIVLSPLFLFPSVFTVAGVAVILLLWEWRRLALGFFLPRTPLDWPLAIMCAMILVGMLVSPDMDWSVGRAEFLVYSVALYYAVVAWVDRGGRLEVATLAYLAAGSLMAVVALLGTAWQYRLPVLSDIAQWFPQVAQGLARNNTGFQPNIVAGALLWVVMPLLALLLARNEEQGRSNRLRAALRDRRVQVVMLTLTGGTLALTQSRGALVGLAAGIGLLAWLRWPRTRPAVAVAGVIGVVLLGAVLVEWWDSDPTQKIDTTGSITVDDNFAVRRDVWQSALHGIRDYPITGIGLDAFRELLPTRYPAPSVPNTYDIGHAHNQLLQAALDLGLPGLGGYLAVWLAAALMLTRLWRKEGGVGLVGVEAALVAGIAAALLASFVHGLFDTVVMVSKPGVLFWAMLALVAALWRLTATNRDPTLQR